MIYLQMNTYIDIYIKHTESIRHMYSYEVASTSRLLKTIGLFCKRAL